MAPAAFGTAAAASCSPLDRFSNDRCVALGAPWSCGVDGAAEAANVTKSGPSGGGVLCCRSATQIGCADGQREGFASLSTHPNIAACAGGWSVAGLTTLGSPACGRQGGDDGANPNGIGCNANDLCAEGWSVCASPQAVASRSATGCSSLNGTGFFVQRTSGPGGAACGSGQNDLFGCGSIGATIAAFGATTAASCAPLDRFSHDRCSALGTPWSCGTDGVKEAANVKKTGSSGGGVLCCRD